MCCRNPSIHWWSFPPAMPLASYAISQDSNLHLVATKPSAIDLESNPHFSQFVCGLVGDRKAKSIYRLGDETITLLALDRLARLLPVLVPMPQARLQQLRLARTLQQLLLPAPAKRLHRQRSSR